VIGRVLGVLVSISRSIGGWGRFRRRSLGQGGRTLRLASARRDPTGWLWARGLACSGVGVCSLLGLGTRGVVSFVSVGLLYAWPCLFRRDGWLCPWRACVRHIGLASPGPVSQAGFRASCPLAAYVWAARWWVHDLACRLVVGGLRVQSVVPGLQGLSRRGLAPNSKLGGVRVVSELVATLVVRVGGHGWGWRCGGLCASVCLGGGFLRVD